MPTMQRRSFDFHICTNALANARPFGVARKPATWSGDSMMRLASPSGAPSKKNGTGTVRKSDICCNRLALMRLVPFSYF